MSQTFPNSVSMGFVLAFDQWQTKSVGQSSNSEKLGEARKGPFENDELTFLSCGNSIFYARLPFFAAGPDHDVLYSV